MKLTPKNSPKISIDSIKRQNAEWEKRVRDHAKGCTKQQLSEYISSSQHIVDITSNIAVALTEKKRIEILKDVLKAKK